MNLKSYLFAGAVGLTLLGSSPLLAGPPVRTNLFSTGFEYLEGFDPLYLLDDQNGWVHLPVYKEEIKIDLPAAGVISNEFAGLGQQAWLGGEFVEEPIDQVQVWHPTIIDPVPTATPIIKFSVLMSIQDSTFQQFDFFRWSFYNSESNRLFSLDFDNADFTIAYQLDDGQFTTVEPMFRSGEIHHLEVTIQFESNTWSAWLDSIPLVMNKPVTTLGQKRTLGQIRALWLPSDPNVPGDNRMVFDNFTLWAESEPGIPTEPRLLPLGRTTGGNFALRLLGEPGCTYAIDYSESLQSWSQLATGFAAGGMVDFVDTGAPGSPLRFYRARLLPE